MDVENVDAIVITNITLIQQTLCCAKIGVHIRCIPKKELAPRVGFTMFCNSLKDITHIIWDYLTLIEEINLVTKKQPYRSWVNGSRGPITNYLYKRNKTTHNKTVRIFHWIYYMLRSGKWRQRASWVIASASSNDLLPDDANLMYETN